VAPGVVLVNNVVATAAPLQTVMLVVTVTTGVGFTVIVYEDDTPVHAFAVGETVIVAVTAVVVVLVAINPAISPLPFAAIPIVVFEFVQANVVPGVELVNVVPATAPPLHTIILAGSDTVGVGFTVMV